MLRCERLYQDVLNKARDKLGPNHKLYYDVRFFKRNFIYILKTMCLFFSGLFFFCLYLDCFFVRSFHLAVYLTSYSFIPQAAFSLVNFYLSVMRDKNRANIVFEQTRLLKDRLEARRLS